MLIASSPLIASEVTPSNNKQWSFPVEKKNSAEQKFTLTTEGNGDCAFHAVLGNFIDGQMVCPMVIDIRKQFGRFIQTISKAHDAYPLILRAIEALLMENLSGEGPVKLPNLMKTYLKYLNDNKKAIDEVWSKFEKLLKNYKEIHGIYY